MSAVKKWYSTRIIRYQSMSSILLTVSNTSRPQTQLPATIRHTAGSNTNKTPSEIPGSTKSIETPAAIDRLKSLPITVVGEVELSGTDSDDDIQVNIQDNNKKKFLKTLLAGS